MDTRAEAEMLVDKYETRDPFELAALLGIVVLHEKLGDIFGYYNQFCRVKFLHINNSLNERLELFTTAHELGHAILHADLNTPFLKRNTIYSIDKLEQQANRFAVDLLFEDAELLPFLIRSVTDAAAYMGVSLELAEYRLSTIEF